MAVVARDLLDTSAAARLRYEAVAERVVPLLTSGLLGTCAAFDLGALYSARSLEEHHAVRADRRLAYEYLATEDVDWRRTADVPASLVATSQSRAVRLADLVASAVAERHRVTVLRYDADVDIVVGVTGQPVEWVVPRGAAS